jgi:endogenous inhibitor of DNA gyrase (YacG/DUF329 family)
MQRCSLTSSKFGLSLSSAIGRTGPHSADSMRYTMGDLRGFHHNDSAIPSVNYSDRHRNQHMKEATSTNHLSRRSSQLTRAQRQFNIQMSGCTVFKLYDTPHGADLSLARQDGTGFWCCVASDHPGWVRRPFCSPRGERVIGEWMRAGRVIFGETSPSSSLPQSPGSSHYDERKRLAVICYRCANTISVLLLLVFSARTNQSRR